MALLPFALLPSCAGASYAGGGGEEYVKIVEEETGDGSVIYAVNRHGHAPFHLELKFPKLNNFMPDTGLPDGLNTWVGEAAGLLSGGQARRLALARAMLHSAPVWVLDEPTEGLDRITEQKFMQELKRKTSGRTLLLITHRLTDLHWMDAIVMLEKGQVAAQGTHSELLESNRRYAANHLRLTQ